MKKIILITSIATIIGSIFYINKPTNAVGSGVVKPEPTQTKLYTTTFTVECPVASFEEKLESKFIAIENTLPYEHCKDCGIGAFIESTDGEFRCSNCRKTKQNKLTKN